MFDKNRAQLIGKWSTWNNYIIDTVKGNTGIAEVIIFIDSICSYDNLVKTSFLFMGFTGSQKGYNWIVFNISKYYLKLMTHFLLSFKTISFLLKHSFQYWKLFLILKKNIVI